MNVYLDSEGKVTTDPEVGTRLLHAAGSEVDDVALNGIRDGLADEVRKAGAKTPEPENKAIEGPPENKSEGDEESEDAPRRVRRGG